MVPQVEQFPKVQKRKKKKKVLLEPKIIAIMNLLNSQVVPDKVFFLSYV